MNQIYSSTFIISTKTVFDGGIYVLFKINTFSNRIKQWVK